ncbi:hypothetical protein CR513_10058, partial [Mucuna pruriens]
MIIPIANLLDNKKETLVMVLRQWFLRTHDGRKSDKLNKSKCNLSNVHIKRSTGLGMHNLETYLKAKKA